MNSRKILVFLILSAVSLAPGFAFAGEFNLAEIQQAIAEKGLHWTAGPAPFTDAEFHAKLMQNLQHSHDSLFYGAPTIPPTPPLPTSWDWRDHNGVTAVEDQASCGSCWAFASVGALESLAVIQGHYPLSLRLSEQELVSCDSDYGAWGCQGAGAMSAVASYLVQEGTVDRACFPYESFAGNDYPCDPCSDATQRTYKAGSHGAVNQDVLSLKQAVYQYGPIFTTMEVFDDFMNYTGGVYAYAYGQDEGGHVVLIIGWNDAGQYFIVKNSWGTAWGMNGFFEIAYSEVTGQTDFGDDTQWMSFGSGPADDDDDNDDNDSAQHDDADAAAGAGAGEPDAPTPHDAAGSTRSGGFGC